MDAFRALLRDRAHELLYLSLPFDLQNIYYEHVLQALMADSPVIIEGVI